MDIVPRKSLARTLKLWQPQINIIIIYHVIASVIQQVNEGHTVFRVCQAVLSDPMETTFGCNTYHCTQSSKSDLFCLKIILHEIT